MPLRKKTADVPHAQAAVGGRRADPRRRPGATRLVPSNSNSSSRRASRISWPLTSFDNTIQNVACIAFLLGFLFAANIASLLVLSNYSPAPCPWTRLNLYAIQLLLFHLLEFLTTAIFNPTRVTVDSFLLNNGASYWYAQLFCVLEYLLRARYVSPDHAFSIDYAIVRWVGIALSVGGQAVRTSAMITAANSFNHRVSTHASKQVDHSLVTHGVYQLCRHPSYFGFFWWSIGIQLFLSNSFSLVFFAGVLWSFFNSRIQTEELHLIKFFGKDYLEYRATTPTLIPFIK
ncbi:hypothetical protein PCASD_25343 [Puccinia coronata f. sp. avenae]|uniref:Protein-S-isoprenylcysteine O-methyltransferase n=1 Tax=Puccinia coronata f. sp. avenae TaxID=200324 RepID=A0A2N5RUP9_9BASI|nr:hypothetical protein PCASD_25343 [Puccinia coronata f. sp. avenae]